MVRCEGRGRRRKVIEEGRGNRENANVHYLDQSKSSAGT